jgi:CRISPR-associated endonuclease/helicase Cas3
MQGTADIIFNTAATGDGKSLAAYLPGLPDRSFRIVGLYPTIELVEDQNRSHRDRQDKDGEIEKGWHSLFGLNAEKRIDRLYGEELSRRVQTRDSNRFQELRKAIEQKPLILTNPDIFHLIIHHQYQDPAYENSLVPLLMAKFPDLWVFDEFHIFGAHQEAAVLNSLSFIRRSQQRKRRFLFTSATPKPKFIEQLKAAGFKTIEIAGNYTDTATPGYRQILQPIALEFVQLKQQTGLEWLEEHHAEIEAALANETTGRGLIILNSVAQTGQAVRLLTDLLPGVKVQEISGRIDCDSRQETQDDLKHAKCPVLVVGTSAVDVGVDFKIHLLIFESSDSATVIQRLGRLGRHPGFNHYQAIALLPEHAPWILAQLKKDLPENTPVDRQTLRDAVIKAFDEPKEYEDYHKTWGALQAQGMLWQIGKDNPKVVANLQEEISADLSQVYGSKFISARCWATLSRINAKELKPKDLENLEKDCKYWTSLCQVDVGKAVQKELLRFRGSTTLQAAVWEGDRFYLYDLLRLLPYTWVEVIEEAEFLAAVQKQGKQDFSFQYAQVFGVADCSYDFDFGRGTQCPSQNQNHSRIKQCQVFLRVKKWVDERIDIRLQTGRDSSELKCCELILLDKLKLINHPQADDIDCLSRKKVLSFLVPGDYWKIREVLKLGALFALHPLVDSSEQTYACAFNQDALLLKAMSYRLTKFCRKNSTSLFF